MESLIHDIPFKSVVSTVLLFPPSTNIKTLFLAD